MQFFHNKKRAKMRENEIIETKASRDTLSGLLISKMYSNSMKEKVLVHLITGYMTHSLRSLEVTALLLQQ